MSREIKESSKFNFLTSIWIVPIIALIIAGWLAYQHFEQRGPEIKIIFPQNEGLVAGQSVVKFRKVPIGKVTKIEIRDKPDDGVVVTVRMNKDATPYMTEKAKFWIVKPEVGIAGVSGLDTLISGTYIDVYSEEGGTFREKHIGLLHPFLNTSGGEYFHLSSFSGNSVLVGTPIYYKNINVGQVEYVYLGLDETRVDVIIFINKEYVPFIHPDSKFWTNSIVNFDYSKGNIDVNLAPMKHILQGGISFSSPTENRDVVVEDKHVFILYESKTKAESKQIGSATKKIKKFLLKTKDSIANLKIESPVRFDGFDIGEVSNISLSYDKATHTMLGEVLIYIDTSVFEDKNEVNTSGLINLYEAVNQGLRAKISPLDPITGMLYVDLTFKHHDGPAKIIESENYAQLPLVSYYSTDIISTVGKILDKINQLPLQNLLSSIQNVVDKSEAPIENANAVLLSLEKTIKNIQAMTEKESFAVLPDELNKALNEVTKTLKSTRKVVRGYDSDSLVKQQLAQTLQVLTKTSQEMQVFLRMLNRNPNSLIFGDN